MTTAFVKRRPELLALEGWYDGPGYRFKLSCRFKDILRCSEFNDKPEHFRSCFASGSLHENQPTLRCMDPNWAIIYTPDIHGNFLGRCFVHYEGENRYATEPRLQLVIDKIYGNKLKFEDIKMKLFYIDVTASLRDTYLTSNTS